MTSRHTVTPVIFKAVGDSRPYPDHGYTTRQWSTVPPRLVRLDELVTTRYRLEDVNQGYRDMLDGRNIRGLMIHDS